MENEMPSVNRVDQIHEELSSLKGQRLRVRAKTLAGLPGFHIHMAEIVDLTRDADSL